MSGPYRTIASNVIAGLTVSFVAISLGAAFGILSGRGAVAGIISAAIIASIAAMFGGTRIQCSGPTAPMTAVTASVVAFAYDVGADPSSLLTPDAFINLVLVGAGILVVLMGVLRLGRYIQLVPRSVVSGFMNGIAILIWVSQLRELFGMGRPSLAGSLTTNVSLASICFLVVLVGPIVLRRLFPQRGSYVPVTLLTIVAVSAFSSTSASTTFWNRPKPVFMAFGAIVGCVEGPPIGGGWHGQLF